MARSGHVSLESVPAASHWLTQLLGSPGACSAFQAQGCFVIRCQFSSHLHLWVILDTSADLRGNSKCMWPSGRAQVLESDHIPRSTCAVCDPISHTECLSILPSHCPLGYGTKRFFPWRLLWRLEGIWWLWGTMAMAPIVTLSVLLTPWVCLSLGPLCAFKQDHFERMPEDTSSSWRNSIYSSFKSYFFVVSLCSKHMFKCWTR